MADETKVAKYQIARGSANYASSERREALGKMVQARQVLENAIREFEKCCKNLALKEEKHNAACKAEEQAFTEAYGE